jgi:hypothetical protein
MKELVYKYKTKKRTMITIKIETEHEKDGFFRPLTQRFFILEKGKTFKITVD